MRVVQELAEGNGDPTRIFPRRPLEWVFQIMGISTIFLVLFTLGRESVHTFHLTSLQHNTGKGSLDPLYPLANTVVRKRRLLEDSDFVVKSLRSRKMFLPEPPTILRKEFYPYNISGAYFGYGLLNYSMNGRTLNNFIKSTLRVRTTLGGSPRYHAVQIQIIVSGVSGGLTDEWNESIIQPEFILNAVGIYDVDKGIMQGMTNSPTYPPELPMFKNRKISYPSSKWLVTSSSDRQLTSCPFLVEVRAYNISRKNFISEERKHQIAKHHRGHSTLEPRDYDVHLKAKIESMGSTCSNITRGIINADLLRYDIFILKSSKYAWIAISLSLLHVLLAYRQMQYSTPANAATKFSLTSIAMHSVFDAYISLLHLIVALYIDDLFYPFIAVFLLQFVVFSVFDLRLVLLV